MGTAQGHKAFMEFGTRESAYGVWTAPDTRHELISWNMSPNIGVIRDPSLNNAPSRRGVYQGGLSYTGAFTIRLNYEGSDELFDWAMGAYTGAAEDTSAVKHTFQEASLLSSRSFEIQPGDPLGDADVWRVTGAKCIGFTARGTAGQGNDAMVTVEFRFIAQNVTTAQTSTGSSFPDIYPVLFHQAKVALGAGSGFDDGTADVAADVRVRSFEVNYEQPLSEDRYYMGSVNIDEPLRNDFLTPTWRITQEFKTLTQWDAAVAFTAGSPTVTFQHPTIIGATTTVRSMSFKSGTAYLTDMSPPVDGYGVLLSTATWEAVKDATIGSALYLERINLTPDLGY